MSEQDRANMLIKAICEIEAACDGANETHRDIWQIAHDAIMNNARAIDQANEANKQPESKALALNGVVFSEERAEFCCANCGHAGNKDNPCNECFMHNKWKPQQT